MKRTCLYILLFLGVVFLAGCAAGPNPVVDTVAADGSIAGFWLGLWHGMISPITFIISLFCDNMQFYEVHNNGGWYNFGFVFGLVGLGSIFGGGGSASFRS